MPSRSPRAAAPSWRSASPSAPPRSRECPASSGFELLRPAKGETRYFVYTRWETEEDFRAWVESSAFTRGHAQAAKDSKGTVAHGSALLEFEVVQLVAPRA